MTEAAHADGGDSQTAMIVIGVVVLVALGAGGYFFAQHRLVSLADEGEIQVARADVNKIEAQLQLYRSNSGMYPTQAQGLNALVEEPTEDPLPKRWAQITGEVPVDRWGNEFNYARPAVKSGGPFDVYSSGPDGKAGTKDDIGNWSP